MAAPGSSSTTRSWRGGPARTPALQPVRWGQRVLLTLLCLGLLALFAWLIIWWIFLPTVHFACLPVVDYDVLAAPPLRFVEEDVQAVAESAPHRPAIMLRDLQTSDAMPTLTKRLEGCQTAGKDTLVLYVAGHGIAEDGTPYILCSDYLRQDGSGRYPLRDLLAQLQAFPADLKLLILDAGALPYDPRAGVVANDFSRLLETEVKRCQDARLWVLSAHQALEVSHVSLSARQSVLGHYVADAVRGQADRNGNRQVDLAELAQYVGQGVSQWVQRESGGRASQVPRWLHGGEGFVTVPPPLTLTPVPRKVAAAEKTLTQPTKAAKEQPPDSAAEVKSAPKEKPASPTGPAGSKPSAKDATPTVPPVAPEIQNARRLLDEAWATGDTLEKRTEGEPWSPADYAPHLWREYQETVLGYEQRLGAGQAFDAKEVSASLQKEILPLSAVLRGSAAPAAVERGTVVERLVQARQRFIASGARALYDQPPAGLELVREAVQLSDDLAFRAVYYVRGHAAASASSPRTLAVHQPLHELLTDGLPALRDLLDQLLDAGLAGATESGNLQTRLDDLRSRMEVLARVRDQIERDGLQREAQQLVREVRDSPQAKGVVDRIESLLAVPLLPASVRRDLLDARGRLEQPFSPPDLGEVPPASSAIPDWKRERLLEQAELEIALVAWADSEAAAALSARLAAVQQASESFSTGSEDAWRLAWQQLGADLGQFYRELPARILRDGQTADPRAVRRAARLLRLVDARDAHRIDENASELAVPPLPRPVETKPVLALSGPAAVDLEPGAWQPLELTVGPAGLTLDAAVVSVQYDAGLVDVESADGKEAVSPGLRHKVRLGEGALRALAYRVRPRGDGPQTTEVVVSIAAAGQTASHRLDVRIPAPETVELSITGPAFAVDRPLDATDHLRLLLFPNRVTPFRFALVNRSGRARKTRVELWSRPASTAVTGDRVLPVDALGSVRPGFERLFGPLDVELPADPTPVTLPFPPPPAGEPAKPAPAKKDASPPESPEAVDKRPIVTPGLVCLVADAANPERQWNTWIDFALRPPRDYLEPDVAYDPIQQQITIAMHPRDADGDGKPDLDRLPPTAAAEPIRLIWNTAGVLEPGTEMKDQAELAPPSYTAALFAKVPAQADKQIPVQLAVDGYPRAFLYNVRCDRIGRPAERERSPCRIRITSPAAGAAFLAPLEVIPVEFQVDAPEDAFQKPGDTVEIGLDENGDRTLRNERKLQWSSDRQVTVRLHKVEPTGNAQFHAEVTDFKTLLPAAGLRNKVVAVLARVNVSQPGTSQGHASDQDEITTVLDGAPPVVRVETPVRPVMVGEEIPVTVLAEDLSGVAKVRVGLDLDASGDLEEAEKPLLLSQPSSSGAWSTALATKDLPPGRYTLVALATDRVGLATKERSVVTLAAPRKPSVAEKKAADTSTIQGRVVLISRPASGIRVTLEGLNRTATSDDKGRFTFRDVPPGSYKLEAKGAALNRFRSGSANVTVPGGGQTVTVDVQIE